jgi:hypothetical protein
MMKPYQSKLNKSTQKRGNTRSKMGGPTFKKTKNHLRGRTTREHQVPKPLPIMRSISNKGRGNKKQNPFLVKKATRKHKEDI